MPTSWWPAPPHRTLALALAPAGRSAAAPRHQLGRLSRSERRAPRRAARSLLSPPARARALQPSLPKSIPLVQAVERTGPGRNPRQLLTSCPSKSSVAWRRCRSRTCATPAGPETATSVWGRRAAAIRPTTIGVLRTSSHRPGARSAARGVGANWASRGVARARPASPGPASPSAFRSRDPSRPPRRSAQPQPEPAGSGRPHAAAAAAPAPRMAPSRAAAGRPAPTRPAGDWGDRGGRSCRH